MERYLRTTAPEAVADCALQPLTFTLTPIPNPSPDPDPNPSPNPNPNPNQVADYAQLAVDSGLSPTALAIAFCESRCAQP